MLDCSGVVLGRLRNTTEVVGEQHGCCDGAGVSMDYDEYDAGKCEE